MARLVLVPVGGERYIVTGWCQTIGTFSLCDSMDGVNPMRKNVQSDAAKPNEKKKHRSKYTWCCYGTAACALACLGAIIAVVVVLMTSSDDDNQSSGKTAADQIDLAAADAFAGTCNNTELADTTIFSHYVSVVYGFEGEVPNCTFADNLNAAAESAFGVSSDSMLVAIETASSGTERRLRNVRATQGESWRAIQTLLLLSQDEAGTVFLKVQDAISDGTL